MVPTTKIIADILREKAHLLGDLGQMLTFWRSDDDIHGFQDFSDMFCDNVVFWCLGNGSPGKEKRLRKEVGKYIHKIRNFLEMLGFDDYNVKFLSTGLVRNKPDDADEVFSKDAIKNFAEEHGIRKRHVAYISVKVAFSEESPKRVCRRLRRNMDKFNSAYIYVHDVDMTVDCARIASRAILRAFVVRNIPHANIVRDRRKVGDHCLSWTMDLGGQRVKCKVYNKFIQMLQSAEVRKQLGSRMDDLVANPDPAFTEKLLRYQDDGFSRIEITFYGSNVQRRRYYRERMQELLAMMQECPTVSVSYTQQWSSLAAYIKDVVAIYVAKRKTFAYCHWWNSVTGKKYGSAKGKVGRDEVQGLLANYSFNDRKIHYFVVDADRNKVKVLSEKIFKRLEGSTAMTLVAGGSKGLYPSKKNHRTPVLDFADVGIVSVNNITIGWPEKRHDKRTKPVVQIYEFFGEGSDDRYMKALGRIGHTGSYVSANTGLTVGTEYLAVAYGVGTYRGRDYFFILTSCGRRIRCGDSLDAIMQSPMVCVRDRGGPVYARYRFYFKAIRQVAIRGVRDMKCEWVSNVE
ncbi:hypothetical protein BGZ73_000919 [Actinomortierella ambigua]|nr:hypothetical protein BGZ73_000919 [Actinomortierella ambigua]